MSRKTIKNENPTNDDMCTASYRGLKNVVYRIDEEWKPIILPNIKEWYYISNYGRVYSKFSNKLLVPTINKSGYKLISLQQQDNTMKCFYIHRLVMLMFNPI